MTTPRPNLSKRLLPKQERASQTIDRILDAAAVLLSETGLEHLSTNLICQRAGLTPPALYRYFPNKHAVLVELGERLMAAQNTALIDWLANGFDESDPEASFLRLLRGQIEATASRPSPEWTLRALHASPLLIDVRLASHTAMTTVICSWALARWPHLDPEPARRHFRLAIEIGYAAIEMISDAGLDTETAYLKETARLLALHHRDLMANGAP